MENEENKGLIDKKASEDQLARFFSIKLLLEVFAQILEQGRKKQVREGQGKERKERKDQGSKSWIKKLQ